MGNFHESWLSERYNYPHLSIVHSTLLTLQCLVSTKRSHTLKQTYSFQDVSLRIQSESGKIRTRKTPNTVTFHAVNVTEGNQKKLQGGGRGGGRRWTLQNLKNGVRILIQGIFVKMWGPTTLWQLQNQQNVVYQLPVSNLKIADLAQTVNKEVFQWVVQQHTQQLAPG